MDHSSLNVSRETYERLCIYLELLKKWNRKINLVSSTTLDNAWSRHFVDSIQVYNLSGQTGKKWVDIGSGAGFPGLVVAIAGMEDKTPNQITLIESDMRKCLFLRTVIRELNVPATVINDRIEKVSAQDADVLSARALADLSTLLRFSDRHLNKNGIALFPKGNNWQVELEQAKSDWVFKYTAHNSQTENGSVIMNISEIQHV